MRYAALPTTAVVPMAALHHHHHAMARTTVRMAGLPPNPEGASNSPGTLILLRHGVTEVPRGTAFIGWSDPDLSKEGEAQTLEAARAIVEAGYTFDVAYTSVLRRAVRTTWLLLQQLDKIYLPVMKHWRLNERCYGAVTASPIDELHSQYGEQTIQSWRRSFDARPPPFPNEHPHSPRGDPRYDRWQDRRGKMRPVALPNGESLAETITRTMPVWKREILPDLKRGRSVLVVAHGNNIRAIVQAIDGISNEQLFHLEVPPGIPLVYRFERKGDDDDDDNDEGEGGDGEGEGEGKSDVVSAGTTRGSGATDDRGPIRSAKRLASRGWHVVIAAPRMVRRVLASSGVGSRLQPADNTELVAVRNELSALPLSGEYLAKPTVLAAAQETVRIASMARYGIGEYGTEAAAISKGDVLDGTFGAFLDGSSTPVGAAVASYRPSYAASQDMPNLPSMAQSMAQAFEDAASAEQAPAAATATTDAATAAAAAAAATDADAADQIMLPGGGALMQSRVPSVAGQRTQHVVIIRHGKTEHNKLGLFTGWEDVSLAPEGRKEATAAGKLLRKHGITFDVVYTSWLSRAIETAWLVLVELDAMWLPINKSWRLNERMYGALTGLSKRRTRTIYGDVQFKRWRRSYNTKPPRASSFSSHYPGNDQRYVDNVKDVRISLKESLIRSLESGKLTVHRKLPRTESLKDCMERTIPYYVNQIEGQAIKQGKSVLIASSENAIRGLLMHLLKIPKDEIVNIEIPTGLPLVFDTRHRCLTLLDGDVSDYNFGVAGELLFTPCELPDDDDDDDDDEADLSSS